MRAAVVVLGDISRSPRIRNHAVQLAKHNYEVDLIGYVGNYFFILETPIPSYVKQFGNIAIHRLSNQSFMLLKLIFLSIQLFFFLLWIPKPDFVLVQNPPSIPTFIVVKLACWLRKSKMVIDWHNLGFTILRLKMKNKLILWVAKNIELMVGKLADFNLTVTTALRNYLIENEYRANSIIVAYDKPVSKFRRLSLNETHIVQLNLIASF